MYRRWRGSEWVAAANGTIWTTFSRTTDMVAATSCVDSLTDVVRVRLHAAPKIRRHGCDVGPVGTRVQFLRGRILIMVLFGDCGNRAYAAEALLRSAAIGERCRHGRGDVLV